MTDNPSPGVGGPGEPDDAAARPQPWFPPSGEPGGYGPPQPGAAPPSATLPGPNGGSGAPGQQGYGQSGYGPPAYGQSGYGPPAYGQPGGYRPSGGYGPSGQAAWQAGRSQTAPKPGVIPLRPLGVGEILDGAFTSIRRNPRATIGLAAILLTLFSLVNTAFSLILVHYLGTVSLPSPGQPLTNAEAVHLAHRLLEVFVPVLAVDVVLGFFVHLVLTGLLTMVIGRSVLGQRITAGEAWHLIRPRLAALLGTTLLVGLTVFAGFVIFGLILVLLALSGGAGGIALLVTLAAVVVTVFMWTMLVTAGVACVLERQGPAQSIARSWRLVRGSFWRVFGISLLTAIICAVTYFILQIPFNVIAGSAGGGSVLVGTGGTATAAFIGAIGQIVAGAVVAPILAGVVVLIYVDLRMRKEGLDLVLLNAAASGSPPTGDEFASLWRPGVPQPPASGPPPPPAW